jgi:hypothetical protein
MAFFKIQEESSGMTNTSPVWHRRMVFSGHNQPWGLKRVRTVSPYEKKLQINEHHDGGHYYSHACMLELTVAVRQSRGVFIMVWMVLRHRGKATTTFLMGKLNTLTHQDAFYEYITPYFDVL